MRRRVGRAVIASLLIVAAIVATGGSTEATPAGTRDPWLRPFRSDSIWNTPVGSEAQYSPATIPSVETNPLTFVYLHEVDPADPVVPVRKSGGWRTRCDGTEPTGHELPLPPDFSIEPPRRLPNGGWRTPNNGAVFLLADGRTLLNLDATARCEVGGPVYGVTSGATLTDLFGDGIGGAHGASHLSHLGGAIRPGELTGSEPIRHVLDIAVFAKYLYSDGKKTKESTYRWPATSSDGYALKPSRSDAYVGKDAQLRMGSLVALPPGLTVDDLGVRSDVGRRLFAALRDYGAYITDDSAREATLLHVDAAAKDEFPWGDTERRELGAMVSALAVIANNGPETVGGGGTPRAAPLPAIAPPLTVALVEESLRDASRAVLAHLLGVVFAPAG